MGYQDKWLLEFLTPRPPYGGIILNKDPEQWAATLERFYTPYYAQLFRLIPPEVVLVLQGASLSRVQVFGPEDKCRELQKTVEEIKFATMIRVQSRLPASAL